MYNKELLDSIVVDPTSEEYRKQFNMAIDEIDEIDGSVIAESAKKILLDSNAELPEEIIIRRKTAEKQIDEMLDVLHYLNER
jgi:hypothetical protein